MNFPRTEIADDYDIAEPNAPAMMQSMRAFGYDLSTAIADLVDNSLTAAATNIWISFEWLNGNPEIAITDDGNGMTEEELRDAMRLSSRNPKEERSETDLGRFGLGLKTASLSQCRQLTVYSKTHDGLVSCRCWDLDVVEKEKTWALLRNHPDQDPKMAALLNTFGHGTAVRWNKIDKMFGPDQSGDELRHKNFLDKIDHVKKHLAMVFHRFMQGPGKVNVFVNDKLLEPWDPFLLSEEAIWPLAEDPIMYRGTRIPASPYILPHRSKLSQKGLESGGGLRGWNDHQGFYIYRNKRLIVAGSWLGLFHKEEHFKLARIQIDIPNNMDEEWNLDVRKAHASPPPEIRADLIRIAKVTRKKASEIYRHRGKIIQRKATDQSSFLWQHKVLDGKYSYKINRDYPLIKQALSSEGLQRSELKELLRLIEETIPTPHIIITNAEQPDSYAPPFEKATAEVIEIAKTVYRAYLKDGLTEKEALNRLLVTEPFNLYPELQEIIEPEL